MTRNNLLKSITREEFEQLHAHAERVTLKQGETLIKPHEPIRFVVFPETCLASLVTVLEDGSTVEGGCVGREGIAGIPAILDAESTPMQTLVQVGGEAIRIDAKIAKDVYRNGESFRSVTNRYVHTLFIVASQSAACNRKHLVDQRLARWLLMSADGIGREDIGITHEFLAAMLGVRRSGVTESALRLQEAGLIDYKRGSVRILDRQRLENAACECYRIVRNEYERLLG